jgi:hypothetical protein
LKNLQLATLGIACLMALPLAAANPPAAIPDQPTIGYTVPWVGRHYPRHTSSRSRMRRIARDGSIYHLTSIDECLIMG